MFKCLFKQKFTFSIYKFENHQLQMFAKIDVQGQFTPVGLKMFNLHHRSILAWPSYRLLSLSGLKASSQCQMLPGLDHRLHLNAITTCNLLPLSLTTSGIQSHICMVNMQQYEFHTANTTVACPFRNFYSLQYNFALRCVQPLCSQVGITL